MSDSNQASSDAPGKALLDLVRFSKHNEEALTGRGGILLIKEMLEPLEHNLITCWENLQVSERQAVNEWIADHAFDAVSVIASRIFRGHFRAQLQYVENAARCALHILKLGMLDNFGKFFSYIYPIYGGKVHDELAFFSTDDMFKADSQTGTDQVESRDTVPPAVTSYMGSLLSLGLLEHMIQAVELAPLSGSRVHDQILNHLIRLTFILPNSGLLQVRDCFLRIFNDFPVSGTRDVRKFDKLFVRNVFREAVVLDMNLYTLSVNELGRFSLSLLKSSLLYQRMVGSETLNVLCEHAIIASSDASFEKFDEIADTLRQLIVSNGILDLLFGPSMHGEVSKFKRCNHIVRIIFENPQNNALVIEQAAFLWKSMFDRHSEVFECCYEAFQHAIHYSYTDVLRDCLHRFFSTSVETLNARPQVLSVLVAIFERSNSDAVVRKEFAHSISAYLLNVQLVHGDDPAFPALLSRSKAILFSDLLKEADASELFQRLCRQCVTVLQNPSATSCKTLEFLLEFYSQDCVDSCENQLVTVLCHVLDALCGRLVLDGYSVSLFAFLSHQYTACLIGPAQEDKLWSALAIETAEEGRRQQAFEFLLQSKNLSSDVQRSILETRLPLLPLSCMSPKALECMLYLIKRVNSPDVILNQVGKKRDRAGAPEFTKVSDMIGLDSLWRFCLSCPDKATLHLAVAEFNKFIIESGRINAGIFQSVVRNCIIEVRSLGVDFVKAHNVISLLLDLSKSFSPLSKGDASRERCMPLGHIIEQPNVMVLIVSEFMCQSMYCSPLMTIAQFRAELVSKFNVSVSFEMFFQIVNFDGHLDYKKMDVDSDYLGRHGPLINCKLVAISAHRSSVMDSRASLQDGNGSELENQHNVVFNVSNALQTMSQRPRAQPPPARMQAASSSVPGSKKRSIPLIRVPLDDDVALSAHQNDQHCNLRKSSSRSSEMAPPTVHVEGSSYSKRSDLLENSHFHLWSMFSEDSENYAILFELGSVFPRLIPQIWELLLLLPVNVEFISQIRQTICQSRMFFNLNGTLEKIYFLSCASSWQNLPSYCFDLPVDSQNFFSSAAVAALDTPYALQSSVSMVTSVPNQSRDFPGSFGSLLLSYHLSAILTARRETGSAPNSDCLSYYLVLLSAGIIGFSDCDFADSHDNFIESILNRFESQNRFENQPMCLHGFNAALASAAVSIIRDNFMTDLAMFLKSFAEIPSARRKSIIRLLLSASSCPNLLQLNDLILQLSLFLHQMFDVSLSSFHQSDVLLGIVDFVTQDVCMLSPTISLYWLYLFLRSRFCPRDENTSVKSLLEAAVRVSSCIYELVGIAKRNKNVYDSKLSILFAVQTFILRLLLPTEIESHPTLASEFTRHFCAIFESAAFPQDTMSLMTDASSDFRINVVLPRPLSADLMRPLCSKVDSVCIELCQLVHEALMRFRDLSAAVFHTLIQRSESMLVFKNLSLTTTSSSFASFHGIINLGCTCYFNSITQQLFMIPGFAASVIAAQVKIDAASQSATAESNSPARCILEKFQDLVINLRHGSDPVVHPKTFCDSFRFPDGSCILPDVQQDALEYFHILCDHLDNALKGSHDEKLLSRFFGGRSATQLLCNGCPHRYERFEHFFTLQLAVFSNRANSVLGALQEFVAGELLEGDNQYFCSQCNKKVDTVKRTVLADLPDTIILGLKRFDFNYDTMQRVKLNLEVPFSHDLDMSPFCRENLGETPADSEPAIIREPGYYQYSLAGIVVHSGMADSGHYFSIIRDPVQTGLWHKFNDDEVTPIQNLDLKQFYGGLSGKFAHTNAYILVYNRKVPLFNHEYEKILSIESAVEQVQCTGKLSMSTMFVNALGMEQLWQCFTVSMQNFFAASDDHQHELAYLDFILKLNNCVEFQDSNAVELFMQPLLQSLRSTKKCYAILEHFILNVCQASFFQTLWFHPITDSNLKGNPTLQPLFTDLLSKVVSSMNECDCSRFKSDEMAVYRNILRIILHFFGHLSFQLFVHFPQENSSDFEPSTAALSFAVQKYIQQALTQGLALSISKFLSLALPSFDDVGFTGLNNMCTTAAYFAHLSENGSKLRSKRRSHLRSFVVDSRYRACWNCLAVMKTCFLEQPSVLVQEMLKNGMWFKCFEILFTPFFFEKYIYTSTSAPPFYIQIVTMFYELSSKLLPVVPGLSRLLLENLHEFAKSPRCFDSDSRLMFVPGNLASLTHSVFSVCGGDQWRLLSELYSCIIQGYVSNRQPDQGYSNPICHAYRMLIVVIVVDIQMRQKPGEESQTLAKYLSANPTAFPIWPQHLVLHRDLESRAKPPCFDDGLICPDSSASTLGTHYFLPVLNLLQATGVCADVDVDVDDCDIVLEQS